MLAPLFGSMADRVSRRRLAVCADLLRALCRRARDRPLFAATVALALLAGVGTALFRPAVDAALPGLVPPSAAAADRDLYASVNRADAGSALAAGLLLITTAPVVLVLNAVSFVVSAGLLAGVDLGPSFATERDDEDGAETVASVSAEAREGARAAAAMPGVPVLMGVGALVVLTGAMFNVLAPLFATGPLHAGGSGYSVLMALYGLGMVAGSWTNARMGSDIEDLRRRWLVGIALSGLAMADAALAPNLPLALMAFTLIGLGENLLSQTLVAADAGDGDRASSSDGCSASRTCSRTSRSPAPSSLPARCSASPVCEQCSSAPDW